ncbi:unnamed protein product, partial [Dracunculus medinensis]|uniref:Protein kinase domain-containing protein n=1 Tax=Dracunculus medinensis TaxID=318479 RepID=A0A0N4UPE6_DRAME
KPQPTIEWIDNRGQPIGHDSKRFKVISKDNQTSLTILGAQIEDEGNFTLRITNKFGFDTCEIPIQVIDYPDRPGRPIVCEQSLCLVRLMWATSGQESTSPIIYVIEQRREDEDVWQKVDAVKQSSTTICNLQVNHIYKFRVRAENNFGQSDPSEESESIFVPDPKYRKENDHVLADNCSKFITDIKPSEYRTIDVTRLPNDFEAKYILCEELGHGSYATIYRTIEKSTGKNWVAKIVKVRPGIKKDSVLHEINIMNQLHHEKLLNLHEAFDLGSEMYLVEELVSGDELLDKIFKDGGSINENDIRNYVRQILQGIQHMHSKGIAHLDLKPETIVLQSENSNQIKIIDFGLARKIDPTKNCKLLFGTAEYCAPEIINSEPLSLSVDMWAVGVITYVMLSGISPFASANDAETLANVAAGDWNFDDASWNNVSDMAKDFISRLMLKDKRKRLTVTESLNHPWIMELGQDIQNITLRQIKNFLPTIKYSGDDLLPLGRLVHRGSLFRQISMDGVFERNVTFDEEYPPKVLKPLENMTANIGISVIQLICSIDGSPSPKLQWFKDSHELIQPSKKYNMSFINGTAELSIKDIEEVDAGLYSVTATNELGSIQCEAKLIVQHQQTTKRFENELEITLPNFHRKLTNAVVKIGEPVLLCASSNCEPQLDVKWYRNNEPIDINSARYVTRSNKGHKNENENFFDRFCSRSHYWS